MHRDTTWNLQGALAILPRQAQAVCSTRCIHERTGKFGAVTPDEEEQRPWSIHADSRKRGLYQLRPRFFHTKEIRESVTRAQDEHNHLLAGIALYVANTSHEISK